VLVIHYKGDWFELPGGRRVECRMKRVVRALLALLAERRAAAPGEPVESDALVGAAWPGEKVDRKTAQHRLYSSLNVLRDLGLREALLTAGAGYLLDPKLDCRVVGRRHPGR
jgi:hypothetical protein